MVHCIRKTTFSSLGNNENKSCRPNRLLTVARSLKLILKEIHTKEIPNECRKVVKAQNFFLACYHLPYLNYAIGKKRVRQLLNCGFVFWWQDILEKKKLSCRLFSNIPKIHFILTHVRDNKRSKLDINLDKTLSFFLFCYKKSYKIRYATYFN